MRQPAEGLAEGDGRSELRTRGHRAGHGFAGLGDELRRRARRKENSYEASNGAGDRTGQGIAGVGAERVRRAGGDEPRPYVFHASTLAWSLLQNKRSNPLHDDAAFRGTQSHLGALLPAPCQRARGPGAQAPVSPFGAVRSAEQPHGLPFDSLAFDALLPVPGPGSGGTGADAPASTIEPGREAGQAQGGGSGAKPPIG